MLVLYGILPELQLRSLLLPQLLLVWRCTHVLLLGLLLAMHWVLVVVLAVVLVVV